MYISKLMTQITTRHAGESAREAYKEITQTEGLSKPELVLCGSMLGAYVEHVLISSGQQITANPFAGVV